MGCMNSKKSISKYDVILNEEEKDYYINIYQENSDEYSFSGTLSSDVTKFYLVFKKEDEEKLPLAISFELSDEKFFSTQYRFLKLCLDKSLDDIGNIIVQFPEDNLSSIFSCDVSPSFPYPVDIKGSIRLK